MFTRVGTASTPIPNPAAADFWVFDVSMFINQIEWFARVSINCDCRLNDFSFSRKPFHIAPDYFNPHKIETVELSADPIVRFMQPRRRRTVKLPVAVFVHAVVEVNYDGQIGLRYPFRDLDFLAQHKIGLVRSSYENYGEPDTVVSLARRAEGSFQRRPVPDAAFVRSTVSAEQLANRTIGSRRSSAQSSLGGNSRIRTREHDAREGTGRCPGPDRRIRE
jgi:hypothetical protein